MATYFGTPQGGAFAAKGTYITSSGKISYQGGSAVSSSSTGSSGGKAGGGGGSSGMSPEEVERLRQEEIKKQEELRKTEEERKKLQEEARKAKEEKIKSGTIAGQVSGEITPGTTGGAYVSPMFVTPKEAQAIRKSGGTTQPIYEVESPISSSGMIEAINIESRYVGGLNLSSKGSSIYGGLSRGQYESNQFQINLAKKGYRAERDFNRQIKEQSELFKSNPSIFAGMPGYSVVETEKGVEYSLGEEYFKTLPSYKAVQEYQSLFDESGVLKESARKELLVGVKKEFDVLGLGTRIKSTALEYGVGLSRTGIGLGEGIINFGTKLSVQTVKFDEQGNLIEPKRFEFGGIAKDIKQIPIVESSYKTGNILGFEYPKEKPLSYFKETILERPASTIPIGVAAGVVYGGGIGLIKNVKTFGLKTGTAETLSYFSPLRIKSGVYAPKITEETKFLGKSVEIVKNGKTISVYEGASTLDKSIKLYSQQISKGNVGGSKSILSYPEYTFYGGKLTEGLRVNEFGSIFSGKPYGEMGFRGESATEPLASLRIEKAGTNYLVDATKFNNPIINIKAFSGLRQQINERIFGFVGGERIQISGNIGRTANYEIETGLFRKQIGGIGYRIEIPSTTGTGIKIFRGGGTKTPFSKTFGYGNVASNIVQTQEPNINFPVMDIPVQDTAFAVSTRTIPLSIYAGTGMYERYSAGQELDLGLRRTGLSAFYPSSRTWTSLRSGQRNTPLFASRLNQGLVQSPASALSFAQPQALRQRSLLRTQQLQVQVPKITSQYGFGYYAPGIFGLGLPFPPLPYVPNLRPSKRKGQRRKQRTGYQPSFTASALGITAKKIPLLAPGGLSLRPIIIK